MSFTPCLISSKTATPRLIIARPKGVGSTPRRLRSSRRTPSVCSRSEIDRETAGWDVPSRSAALCMLPACTTDSRTRTSWSLRRRSTRSILSMTSPLISILISYDRIRVLPYYHKIRYRLAAGTSERAMASLKLISAVIALVLAGEVASAEQWPTRPVTMVVPSAAGGGGDVFGRVLAPRLAELLGQPVIIENVGGAGGMTGTSRVAKAAPDGYQFVFGNIGTHAHNQSLYRRPLYNAATDFAPVALVAETAAVLIARKDLPVGDLAQFIAYAEKHQQELQFGSGGAGSPPHLACALLNSAIGVKVTHIPYRSGAQALQDLMAGRNDYQCSGLAISLPQIESSLIKAIALFGREALTTHAVACHRARTGLDRFRGHELDRRVLAEG